MRVFFSSKMLSVQYFNRLHKKQHLHVATYDNYSNLNSIRVAGCWVESLLCNDSVHLGQSTSVDCGQCVRRKSTKKTHAQKHKEQHVSENWPNMKRTSILSWNKSNKTKEKKGSQKIKIKQRTFHNGIEVFNWKWCGQNCCNIFRSEERTLNCSKLGKTLSVEQFE